MKPSAILPDPRPFTDFASQMGRLLADTHEYFLYAGAIVRTDRSRGFVRVKPDELVTEFESVAELYRPHPAKGLVRGVCSAQNARLVFASPAFRDAFPEIKAISTCPVLVEHGCQLVEVKDYDKTAGVYVRDGGANVPDLDKAVSILRSVLADFSFLAPGDESRAIASLITPALTMGKLLGPNGRAPLHLVEADQSQAGKGYLNQVICAIYNTLPATVAIHTGGVGGLKEAFDSKLRDGSLFVVLDNVRGNVDLQWLESFLTEPLYNIRCFRSDNIAFDPSRVMVGFTSNSPDVTPDLANRASIVRIKKRPEGYPYEEFPEGYILEHIQNNQPKFLGAVFAVVREWHRAGKPSTPIPKHRFRDWAGVMDWIIGSVFDGAPLFDGHSDAKSAISLSNRQDVVAIAGEIVRSGASGRPLYATDIARICVNADLGHFSNDLSAAARGVGRVMKAAFGSQRQELTVDGYSLKRSFTPHKNGTPQPAYVFDVAAGESNCGASTATLSKAA